MTQGEGRLLGARYRLDSVLGRGGMGTVWLAKDEVLGREVAVKEVIAPRGLEDHAREVLYKRMLREARAAARLSHPGIVVVHDVVEENGVPWIVMEYVRARTLQDSLDSSGPLPVDRVAEIGEQVLGALRAAHAAGILHRDVKPANVMLADDRVILTDFGVAQLEGDAALTQTGIVMGSPAYLSPERAQGLKPGPASDLWALGMLMYAACEGTPPFERPEVLSTLAAVMMEPLPEPSRAGPLVRVITGLLDKDPEARLDAATAAEMLHRAHAEARAVPVTPAPRFVPESQRSGDTYESLFRPIAPAVVTMPDPGRAARPAPPPPAPPSVPTPRNAETRPAYGEQSSYAERPAAPSPPTAGPRPAGGRTSWRVHLALAVAAVMLVAGVGYAFRDQILGTEQTQEALGYTLTLPEGWRQAHLDSKLKYATWEDPKTGAYVQLDLRDWSDGDAGVTPSDSFKGYGAKFEDYEQTGLRTFSLGGTAMAELRHRFSKGGKWMRAINRRFISNDRHVALFVVFPGKTWGKNKTTAQNILDSCAS
ncbi:serine/threonine protein kinase [Actinocorallia herbida]|uniref:non-specific serine/threonine protein kinase n=1 Tax=Actinocorallia herbida TaxID=58109 RepID=A0A3N1D8Q9_9ACTN|nr:serine/threonine-protein kinase [Actinocorallia herbida]ROO89905.1 serine/threonine protein kinase [Actinocorallia herbida]